MPTKTPCPVPGNDISIAGPTNNPADMRSGWVRCNIKDEAAGPELVQRCDKSFEIQQGRLWWPAGNWSCLGFVDTENCPDDAPDSDLARRRAVRGGGLAPRTAYDARLRAISMAGFNGEGVCVALPDGREADAFSPAGTDSNSSSLLDWVHICVYRPKMKRRELESRLRRLGWQLVREGGSHSIFGKGEKSLAVPRHREINEHTARAILRAARRGE